MGKLNKYLKPKVVVEKGEYVRNNAGQVMQVSQKMPTHDDIHKVTSTGTEKVKKGQGGVELEGIESVVSATQENRNQKDSTYTVVDDSIKLRPQDAQDWAMSKFGIKIAKPKSSLSFSKAITLVKDQVDIKVKKYEQAFPEASDKLVLNAAKANKEVLETLPSLEDIYEQALQDQEALKIPVPQQNAQVGTMQDYGFKSPQTDRYNFKKKVPTKEELLSDQKQVLARNKEIVAARYRNVASSQLAREAPNQFSPDMIAQKTQAIGDKFRIFPNDPSSFIDDYLNPGVMIGDLASGVGQIPKNVQDKEYGKAALNLAAPVAIGALASMGAKGNGQFVNNLINPVADAIPFRITPNSAEINQFKDLFKPKEAFVGLNETERQTIRAVRNTGSQLARGVLDTPEKGLTFLNKLKTRAAILSDSEFQNLTGFNKSSIDEKIDDLKNASKKKEEEVLGLEDQDDALYDVQYTPVRTAEETRDFYLNTPSDIYQNIGRAADSSFLRRYRELVDEQRLNDNYNQLAPPPEILNFAIDPIFNPRRHAPKPFLFKKALDKVSGNLTPSNKEIEHSLLPSLFAKGDFDTGKEINNAFNIFKNLEKGRTVNAAYSLSSDSKLLELQMYQKAVNEGLANVNYHGERHLNGLGFGEKAKLNPTLIKKEIDTYINTLNKTAKTKIPLSKLTENGITYPDLSVTRKQVGGELEKRIEKGKKWFKKKDSEGKYPKTKEVFTAQAGTKTKLKPYPYMKGSRPALGTTSGKSIESLDGRSISMDQIYDADSVEVQGDKAKTFYKSKLQKYLKK